MARPHLLRRAYFVAEPIANSFPKPQRSKSQVHNCSLNQSANFVVSLLQTVGLESFIHRTRLLATHIEHRRTHYGVQEGETKIKRKIYWIMSLWFTDILHWAGHNSPRFATALMAVIVFLRLCRRDGPHSERLGLRSLPPSFHSVSPQSVSFCCVPDGGRHCGWSSVTLEKRQGWSAP